MALADTAKLVASLVLEDKFTGPARNAESSIDRLSNKTRTLGQVGGHVSAGLGSAVQNLGRIALVGVGVIGANVAAGIQSLKRLEEVNVATNQVIESTGGVAGVTAEQVRSLAEEFESLNATMDDKVIQSAENVLLTFTSIGQDVFPEALEAALDMNQALGGGEEGLQGTIIQLGKALQDPIRGITALRRTGVNFTTAQQDQIAALVESNDLFGAQQIILQELRKEFGGQFAAAGTTATAKFAKFKDAIEDAQMALATAFLPVLEKVADKLTTLLADPEVLASIEDFGGTMADAFDSVVELAGNLPWDSIGNAFKLMGTGSKALLDAFTGLPPWVQTAVITGWGLNKLTGGALTGIVGALASGLVRGILGINAGVVNVNAATANVGGPGAGAPAGGGSAASKALMLGGAVVGGVGIGLAVGAPLHQEIVRPSQQFFESRAAETSRSQGTGPAEIRRLEHNLEAIDSGIADLQRNSVAVGANIVASAITGDQNIVESFMEQRAAVVAQLTEARRQQARAIEQQGGAANMQRSDALRNWQAVQQARFRAEAASAERRSEAARQLSLQASSLSRLQAIERKDFAPTINVKTQTNLSVSGKSVQASITAAQLKIGTGPQKF